MPSFYLSINGAYHLNRHLRSSTGSQVYCSSAVACGVSGGTSFSPDKCTQLDSPCSLTAMGVVKSTLQGPFHFGKSWCQGNSSFQVLRRTWSSVFVYEGIVPSSVVLVGTLGLCPQGLLNLPQINNISGPGSCHHPVKCQKQEKASHSSSPIVCGIM